MENYKRHRESVHNEGQKVYECPACSARFARADRLTRHQKIHRRDRGFRCDLPDCGLSFNRSDLLVRHIQVVHKGIKRVQTKGRKGAADHLDMNPADLMMAEPQPAPKRGRGKNAAASQQQQQQQQQMNHHLNNTLQLNHNHQMQMVQIPVQVSLGPNGISNHPFMNSGSAFHASTSGQMMGPSSAVAIASSLQMLQKMPGMVNSNQVMQSAAASSGASSSSSCPPLPKSLQPNLAGVQMQNEPGVERHNKSHSNKSSKSYVCADCGQSFKSQSNYYRHRKTHDDMPVVFCSEKGCNYQSFSRIDLYKRHRETVHKEGPQKTFECTTCGAKFARVDRLARHDREVHKGIKRNKNNKSAPGFMIPSLGQHLQLAVNGSSSLQPHQLIIPTSSNNDSHHQQHNQSSSSNQSLAINNHPFSIGLAASGFS